jgi:hypothetical protein
MDRREFLRTLGLGAAALFVRGCGKGSGTSSNLPNIVFINEYE